MRIEGITTGYLTCAESNIYLAYTNCNRSLPPPFHWKKPPGSWGQPTENPTESPLTNIDPGPRARGEASIIDEGNPQLSAAIVPLGLN